MKQVGPISKYNQNTDGKLKKLRKLNWAKLQICLTNVAFIFTTIALPFMYFVKRQVEKCRCLCIFLEFKLNLQFSVSTNVELQHLKLLLNSFIIV